MTCCCCCCCWGGVPALQSPSTHLLLGGFVHRSLVAVQSVRDVKAASTPALGCSPLAEPVNVIHVGAPGPGHGDHVRASARRPGAAAPPPGVAHGVAGCRPHVCWRGGGLLSVSLDSWPGGAQQEAVYNWELLLWTLQEVGGGARCGGSAVCVVRQGGGL